ncbi:aminopeptidase N [Gimibacter soli]|uniref:Aminopeptidase N n=1 Tax=Gimibacter soli TaxID=3024400 RepID=A0AAE9XQF0_9PROT|nr:aminopeptidase N [Gimibacter soli]WCL53020.1 aminopeptidase N [Gimibacter soli]
MMDQAVRNGTEAQAEHKVEIFLADYEPPKTVVTDIRLVFCLFDTHADITATSTFTRNGDLAAPMVLDAGDMLEIVSVKLDGVAARHSRGKRTLTVEGAGAGGTLEIVTRIKPQDNTKLEGLYRSGGMFCTQCEAEGFRQITAFPDRPDVMARYAVRIEADKASCPVLLSNGNPVASGGLGEGRHFAEWEDPFPKPSYLFALVAGDLGHITDHFTTASGRRVTLNIYADPRDLDKCDHAMESLKRSMRWDEEVYGLEYDLDLFNIVAVGDFNMGAMENKGLNVFNTKCVLASPETATDRDYDSVEGIIGHEYFHNWTGNRVTCRDWFQLSLKEGLTVFRDQEFSADMGSRAVKRLDDVRILRSHQFPEDGGPLAHPVRPDRYVEINNFYTVTVYNKGAEVIRMMHRLIGAEAFRKGMDLYFARHDGQAVTCDDFAAAMADASGKDLSQFKRWYSQAGTPVLSVSRARTGNDVIVTIEQETAPTPGQPVKEPFHMPFLMGWVATDGQAITPVVTGGDWREDGCLLEVREGRQSFTFKDVPEGAVPSLLRGFSAPVRLKSDLTREDLAFLLRYDSDPFARWEAAQTLARDQVLGVTAALIEGRNAPADTPFSDAVESLFADKALDPAFLAELLTLPGEVELGQMMEVLEPGHLHEAREATLNDLATRYEAEMRARYDSLRPKGGYKQDGAARAARRLANLLLQFLARRPGGDALVKAHYEAADNMTDRIAALSAVSDSDFACRGAILADFYERSKDEPLVLDKWFAVQATSRRGDTVQKVRELSRHPAFTLKNPNRLRSLVSSFTMLNQAGFHDPSGQGYRFLAETILAVDKINPLIAARLVAPLGRWARVEPARQAMMLDSLRFILDEPKLSDDVRELAAKSLKG